MEQEQQDRLVESLRRVTSDLRRARGRIAELESPEPVAIVGMGCRLPGGIDAPEQLWDLVVSGGEAISGFPTDRGWDLDALGAARAGGFLSRATEFDAAFFGISPREAAAMDPQQRLLLEVTWEALERAGVDPSSLRGGRAGVFVGTYRWGRGAAAPEDDGGHALTGTASSVLSGRLAYVLGTLGPALTVDTACSSSLVALHLAVQSLRAGESSLAVVGGATVLTDPAIFPEFDRQGGLAPDGRCKAFSDGADGTGWSEGVGVLVLERLSEARRLRHPVLALVRGSAVGSDGASNGLTAPSGPAQERVIRRALASAGLSPQEVDAVEAHGTGTRLGDPVEAQALLATYGTSRDAPLLLGSLKSNLGHTQAAAGVAGVIKTVLAMRHRTLPRTLHVATPSTRVDWSAGRVALLARNTPWPDTGRPPRAGVSSFGISGTNAHVVLEGAPPEPAAAPASGPSVRPQVVPWPVSARTAAALDAQITRTRGLTGSAVDIGWSLSAGRATLDHRAVLLGGEPGTPELARGEATDRPLTLLFPGQAPDRPGTIRALAERFPVVAAAIDAVRAECDDPDPADPAGPVDVDGALAAFAAGVALFRLVSSCGVRPDQLVGYGPGEVAAAHVAGVLSLRDAVALVAARARRAPAGVVGTLTFREPRIPVVANLTGAVAEAGEISSPEYWARTVDDPVWCTAEGTWLHLGPAVVPGHRPPPGAVVVPLLEPGPAGDAGQELAVVTALARLHVEGPAVDLTALFAGTGARRVDVPTTVFTPQRFAPSTPPGPGATLRHHETWVPVAAPAARPGRCVVVAPEVADPAAVAWVAAALGDDTVVCGPDGPDGPGASALSTPGLTGVVSLLGLDETTDEAGTPRSLAATAELLRRLEGVRAPLWSVTRGAVDLGDGPGAPAAAALWGLGRVAALEYPDRWGGLIDLPALPALDDATAAALAAVVTGARGENEVALRGAGVLARRLVAAPPVPPGPEWTPSGTVVITGGTGALGAHVARLLAGRGAEHLLLLSRRGPAADGATALRDELTALGARVTVTACDVADRAELATALAAVPAELPLTAVVHAAGVLDDGVLERLDGDRFAAVFRAKVASAALLDELTRGADLAAFVLFSSISAAVGNPGQANYAAANEALHAVARRRRAEGRPATAVAWGAWNGTGMAAGPGVGRRSLGGIDPDRALAVLATVTAEPDPVVVVADLGDPAGFGPGRSGLFALLGPAVTRGPAPAAAPAAELARRVRGAPEAERPALVLAAVREAASAVLRSTIPLPPDRVFRDGGFDSLTAVELRNRLAAGSGLPLPTGVVFDHPTPLLLAAHLLVGMAGPAAAPTEPVPRAVQDPADPADPADPVVVVGMACRLPGGIDSPERFWEHLMEGRDAVGPFPTDRDWDLGVFDGDDVWAGADLVSGFVHDALDFDAGFFGISPREATTMDPQQRLLLELTWEALERSGQDPATLRGSRTGVFVGTNGQDYGHVVAASRHADAPYAATGLAASVLSGRLSYTFAFEGPSATVDTACSASLLALHQAARALRAGECTQAVVGGVTVMTEAESFARSSRLGAVALDGRAKAFSDDADGTGYAEGAAVVVVERLSDARRHGHPVLAVLRGSAVNSDGASNGLTAPNGPAQQRVIRAALDDAGLRAADIDAVEAHGTGTRLGDPIEASALLATYGQERTRPLWLGSVKSNVGHTQAAAGVVGVIKVVLALRHGVLPRTLHVGTPSSRVDWTAGAVALLTEPVAWPETGRPRRAGVSAFGISGTNVHAVLEQAPDEPAPAAAPSPDGIVPWVLSARSPEALAAQVANVAATARRHPTHAPADVGWSLVANRSVFGHRAVLLGGSREELLAAADASRGVRGEARECGARPVFVFPGHGAQWWGMGRELLADSEVFRRAVDACAAAFEPHLDRPLTDVLAGVGDPGQLERVDVLQPALFAMMVGLVAQWRSFGVEPGAVVGHSQGEVAAAHVAGALTLEDAARLVAVRSRGLESLAGRGGLLSVAAPAARVGPMLDAWPGAASLAVVNGPSAVVVSGAPEALGELAVECTRLGIRAKTIPAHIAGHGPHVEEIREELLGELSGLRPRAGSIPFYSTVTGGRVDTADLDAGYWYANVRRLVRLEEATRALAADGFRSFVEVGAHPVLAAPIEETCEAAGAGPVAVLGTLRRDDGGTRRFLTAVAEAHVSGVPVDWRAAFGAGRRSVDLPTYPFQRRRYWAERRAPAPVGAPPADGGFWRLVEEGDLRGLSAELAVDEGALAALLPALGGWRERARLRSATDDWCHRAEWTRLAEPAAPAPGGRLLVLVPAGSEADPWVAGILAGLGPDAARLVVDGAAPAAALVGDHLAIVSLLGLDERPCPDRPAVPAGLATTLALVQAARVPVWCVTRGAVAAFRGEPVPNPVQGALWGFGRVAAVERPATWGGLVDLPPTLDGRTAERLRGIVAGVGGEDQVAVREAGVFGRRLVRAAPVAGGPWRARGTVLITGGTGGIGRCLARWAVDRGADHVVLTSRRGPAADGVDALRAELGRRGARVTVAAVDAADRAGIAALLAEFPPSVVVHAAGVAEGDGEIASLTPDQLDDLLRAKLVGARHLHELTSGLDLDAFVLFSSGASAWGSAGQPGYAAGNAYLDALAEHRHAAGLAATSVAWGGWAEVGMATDPGLTSRLARMGVHTMPPDLAVTALERILAEPAASASATRIVTATDWSRFIPNFTAVRPSHLFDALATQEVADGPERQEPAGLVDRLAPLPGAERARLLRELVRREAATTIGHADIEAVPAQRAFRDLGFDSVSAVDLRNRLRSATGLGLPVSLAFDHPTAADLAVHLLGLLFPGPDAEPVAAAEQQMPSDDDVSALDDLDGAALLRLVAGTAPDQPRP